MIRLNSYQRYTAVAPSIQKFLWYDREQEAMYGLPSLQELMQFSVVAMTCAMAGCLIESGNITTPQKM
jgi:hypothetical protein